MSLSDVLRSMKQSPTDMASSAIFNIMCVLSVVLDFVWFKRLAPALSKFADLITKLDLPDPDHKPFKRRILAYSLVVGVLTHVTAIGMANFYRVTITMMVGQPAQDSTAVQAFWFLAAYLALSSAYFHPVTTASDVVVATSIKAMEDMFRLWRSRMNRAFIDEQLEQVVTSGISTVAPMRSPPQGIPWMSLLQIFH